MPTLTLSSAGEAKAVDLCDDCMQKFLAAQADPAAEIDLCEPCCRAASAAGLDLRRPRGHCACCRQGPRELVAEWPDCPAIMFCADCCDPVTSQLKEREGVCTGCFRSKKVKPAYALGSHVFDLCRACLRRYRPGATY